MFKGLITFFRENYHNQGYRKYKTNAARKEFGMTLIRLSDKLTFAIFIPLISMVFVDSDKFLIQLGLSLFIFGGSLYLRHQGLLIIDLVSMKHITRTSNGTKTVG